MPNKCVFCELIKAPRAHPTFIAEFPSSVAFLNFNQTTYPGQSLLILRDHHEHLHLTPAALIEAMVPDLIEITRGLLSAFGGYRANHESLGNSVPHLHWHIAPRYEGDLNEGGPPLHNAPHRKCSDTEFREIAERIRSHLAMRPV